MARAHGLKGEVVVELITNRTERLAPGAVLETDAAPLRVTQAKPHGNARWVVAFAGVDDRAAADALRGATLRAPSLAVSGDETLWVHEVIGSEVFDGGDVARGRVTDVQANPASDLLVLDSGALVPMRFVVSQEPGRIVVDTPAGLFDL